MFDDEKKTIRRMAPHLQRVLIVDPQATSAAMVGEAMRNIARSQTWIATTPERGLKLCETVDPQVAAAEWTRVLAHLESSRRAYGEKAAAPQLVGYPIPSCGLTTRSTMTSTLMPI